jgi:hypothetical protein
MNATIHKLSKHGNGDVNPAVATHAMDVLDAAYHTAHSYPGGVPQLARRMPPVLNARGELAPMSASTLQHKVNPNCLTHHVTLREARDMMVLSQDFGILHALSADVGHVSLRMTMSADGTTVEKVLGVTREFGDVLSSVAKAEAKRSERGRRISANELREIERQACELIGAVSSLVSTLRSQAAA